MKVKQVFELALKMGMLADPRGQKGIKNYLAGVKKEYENLKAKDKPYFDTERLANPYSDSRVHVDDGQAEVRRVLAGIDIDDGEILLASQLGERGQKVDLVIAHHPTGRSLAALHDVMDMAVEVLEKAGVPVHIAEHITDERVKEVGRGVHPINHYQLVNMAELLRVNLINTHTVTDNLVHDFLQKYITRRAPRTVGDLVDALLEIPEYSQAKKLGAGPCVFSGNPKNRLGKWLLEMTGGTNPADKVYKELSGYGISTIIGMHMKDAAREVANQNHMNVVVAGHMASDSLGMNLFLDELEKKGVKVLPCGGLIRVSRVGKKKK